MFKNLFKRSNKSKVQKDLEYYLIDAIYAFENCEFGKAAKQFEMITKAFPDHPLSSLMLGRSLIELKEYERATDALFIHLNIVPESVEARLYLGLTYFECGEMAKAEERFEQALKLREESIMVRENLAITRLQAGELDAARNDLIDLHEQKPDDPKITELLVLVLGRLGMWEAAKQYVHKMNRSNLTLSLEEAGHIRDFK